MAFLETVMPVTTGDSDVFAVRFRISSQNSLAVLGLSRTKQGCVRATYEVSIRHEAVCVFVISPKTWLQISWPIMLILCMDEWLHARLATTSMHVFFMECPIRISSMLGHSRSWTQLVPHMSHFIIWRLFTLQKNRRNWQEVYPSVGQRRFLRTSSQPFKQWHRDDSERNNCRWSHQYEFRHNCQ